MNVILIMRLPKVTLKRFRPFVNLIALYVILSFSALFRICLWLDYSALLSFKSFNILMAASHQRTGVSGERGALLYVASYPPS